MFHSFLFQNNAFDTVNQAAQELKPWFATAATAPRTTTKPTVTVPLPSPPQPPPTPLPTQGTLYECVYRFHHGDDLYRQVLSSYGNKEYEERQTICRHLQSNISMLRETKPKHTKAEAQALLSSLMTVTAKDELDILMGQVVYYGLTVWVLVGPGYFVFSPPASTESERICVVRRLRATRYALETTATPTDIQNTHMMLQTWDKPVLAASHYKVAELATWCEKLQVPLPSDTKKHTKTALYEALCRHIVSFLN